MKLENINMYLIGRFMFCVSIDKVPQNPSGSYKKTNKWKKNKKKNNNKKIQWISLLRYHNTRSAHNLYIPSVKLDLSKTGIKYRGTIVWNIIAESGI